jgi:flagellar basal body-associated protein FliL
MKITLDSILNSINKFRIGVELNNQNYTKAEKIAKKNPILKDYLLNIYQEKNLHILYSDFYNHSD